MKIALTSVATCAVAAMVSTIGLTPASAANGQSVNPSVDEHSLTSISKDGLDTPGARAASESTSQITKQSTTNLPDLFRSSGALEKLSFADSQTIGTFGQSSAAQSTSLTDSADESSGASGGELGGGKSGDEKSGQGDLSGNGAGEPSQSPSQQPSESPSPDISGGVKDKTEDGITIAAISDVLDVPSDHSSIVGLTSTVESGAKVEIRTKDSAGEWGQWGGLDYEANESDQGGKPGTAPFVVSNASAVQVRILGDKAPEGAKLVTIDPKRTAGDASAVNENAPVAGGSVQQDGSAPASDGQIAAQGAQAQNAGFTPGSASAQNTAVKKVAQPKIASRKDWGANESLRSGSPSYASSLKAAVVHQTEGSNSYSASDVPGIIRGIYTFHTKERGWADIGYNVLVDRFGRLWQGRAGDVTKPVIGAHVRGYNTGTFGISVMGSFNNAQPTSAAVTAVEQAIAWKLSAAGVGANDKATVSGKKINAIVGHRDLGDTDCPGANLYSKLPQIRKAVAQMQSSGAAAQPAPSPSQTPPKTQQPKPAPTKQPTAIGAAYKGKESLLGTPVGGEQKLDGGVFQQYQKGYITWKSGQGTRVISGSIAKAWTGAVRAQLGLPKGNEQKLDAGAYQSFSGGDIHWSSKTGAHATWGELRRYWGAKGYERGHLGYPTSNPTCSSSERCEQNFTGGRISWVKGIGVTESSLGAALSAGVKDGNAAAPKPGAGAPKSSPSPAAPSTQAPKPSASPKPAPKPTTQAPKPSQPPKPTPKPNQTKQPAPAKSKAQIEKETRAAIIKEARKHLGVRYVWGGTSPTKGWDCSGFVQYVYAKNGIKLPRTSGEQKAAGEVIPRSQAKPGDLIWHPGHIAIVSDKKGYLIDAGSPRTDTSERKWDFMLNSGGIVIRVVK